MAEQKVNSSESNDDDDVFNSPDDLDLETVRRVKDALSHTLRSFYEQRIDNTARRQQKQIVIHMWNYAMRELFVYSLPAAARRPELATHFCIEQEDERFNVEVFCLTCPMPDLMCKDAFCPYFAVWTDGDGYEIDDLNG